MGKPDWDAVDRIEQEMQNKADWWSSIEGQETLRAQKERADFVHDYIGQASEAARHYHYGLLRGLLWAGQVAGEDPYTISVNPADWGVRYSPSGSHRNAEGFYAPVPKPPSDSVVIHFDPVLFLCMEMEEDAEGDITEISFARKDYVDNSVVWAVDLRITIACTETDNGIPDDFDAWYAWESRTAELRDSIAKLEV